MSTLDFGEKTQEYSSKHKKNLPVWKTPKYEEAKQKAMDIIDQGKYGLDSADFWILMNTTKSEKMAYTGLIISHNGCLKINDCLTSKFDPECVQVDKNGYLDSLVYSYCNKSQGIYEVGEVNGRNCQNGYPYAMAYKRLFDRVVLKLSKLAYSGIYSDSESDEFTQKLESLSEIKTLNPKIEDKPEPKTPHPRIKPETPLCPVCGEEVEDVRCKDGSIMPAGEVFREYGMCADCKREQNGNRG